MWSLGSSMQLDFFHWQLTFYALSPVYFLFSISILVKWVEYVSNSKLYFSFHCVFLVKYAVTFKWEVRLASFFDNIPYQYLRVLGINNCSLYRSRAKHNYVLDFGYEKKKYLLILAWLLSKITALFSLDIAIFNNNGKEKTVLN